MKRTIVSGALFVCALSIAMADPVDLAGKWRFQLDRGDRGLSEDWQNRMLRDHVKLPGDLSEQGIGDPPSLEARWIGGIQKPNWYLEPELAPYSKPGNFKFPYWLTPEKHYVGAAWYQRDIEIPSDWSGQRVVLHLERPHWETRVWIDGNPMGTNNALGTPHVYDLGQVAPGKHVLTVRVDNRMIVDVGENSHSVSDHTQGNWNGIVGRIQLKATPRVWIEDLRTYPLVGNRAVRIVGILGNATSTSGKGTLILRATPDGAAMMIPRAYMQSIPVAWGEEGGTFELELELGSTARMWDEFNPAFYKVAAELQAGDQRHRVETVVGLRELGTQGTQFTINGRKAFFRGTLECAIFPRTGHPPTDVNSWDRIMKVARAHGLNMLRFHSWCPPEAAFIAADRNGIYLQVECSSWANQSTTLGDGKPVDAWIYEEADRILKHYGNHPSFVLMLYGNEPGGPNHKAYLEEWVSAYKAKDPRRLYSSGAGWPQIEANEFHLTPDPRIQLWGQGLRSRINGEPPETTTDYRDYINARKVPVISHEIGQWCVYPNLEETRKYTGYLKARNFEIFRDSLKANHMGHQARQFLLASGKLQALCYKEDIESALRTPGMGGFQLLDLHDFPGQGTALVGVLDPFWEEKGYISPKEYNRFCSHLVPLARLNKRVFTTGETIEADLEVAHFGPRPMEVRPVWKLVGATGKPVANGELPKRVIEIDNAIELGRISINLTDIKGPQNVKLVVSLETASGDRARYENDWDLWVYPSKVETEPAEDVTMVEDLNESALQKLAKGQKVLLVIPKRRVQNLETNKVVLGFSSIFWNTAWTSRQPPTTLGILCDPKHPALAEFPTEYHSNWQWWYLISRAGAMILDDMPAKLRPTVQVIDDWVTNHRLGLLFEARMGKGKLMVCSVDLSSDLESDPVRRQFRHSVLKYMSSRAFSPKVQVTADQVRALIKPVKEAKSLPLASIRADSEELGYEAENAIDMDPDTIWHTAWTPERKPYPHHLTVEFKAPLQVAGVTLLPRQDGNRNGHIKDYVCHVSTDGKSWGAPVAQGTFTQDMKLKTVKFDAPVAARFVRFTALSGFGSDAYSSLAEFSVLEEGVTTGMRDERGIPVRQARGVQFSANNKGVVSIPVDGLSTGLVYDGVGAVSAGGSTRLLVDYPEPERAQILDYLFKPAYGAALQILKVEIGADTDSTSGAEPSHERDRGQIRADRGYEWWLMKEAKARNPEIKLAGLAWGAPGWVSNFWSDANIDYTINWLHCARSNGLHIDYIGGGNERGWDADYYVKLKAALKQHGFGHILLVASDDHNPPNYWAVASDMKRTPAFFDAVDIIGQHDVCIWRTLQKHCSVSTTALESGKPLWDSENSTQDIMVGVEPLARVMTRHYIDGAVTANLNWALVDAWYGTFPAAGTGLILAERPWSGYYRIGKAIWVDAHQTQFTKAGWRYLDSASGYTPGGASLVTLRSQKTGDYSIYIETVDLGAPEILDILISGGLSKSVVHVWATDLKTEDTENDFRQIARLQPESNRVQMEIKPGFVYTLSTTTGQGKGTAQPRNGIEARMPLPYEEDFEKYPVGSVAFGFSDVHGGYEIVQAAGDRAGKACRQMVRQEPILWHRAKMPPTTIVGDPHWPGDYEVSADVLLEGPGYAALIGRLESQQHTTAGYLLQIDNSGQWQLLTQDVRGDNRVLASGTNSLFGINQWHRLALRFEGDQISALFNGDLLGNVRDDSHTMGQVGFRVSPWQHAQFDNLRIVPTRALPRMISRSDVSTTASSEQAGNHHGRTHVAFNAIDDRVETTWRSEEVPSAANPQALTIDLGRARPVEGLVCRPSVATGNQTGPGFISEYNVALSLDGATFEKVASGKWDSGVAARTAAWPKREARYVRLEALASSTGRGVEVSEVYLVESFSPGATTESVANRE